MCYSIENRIRLTGLVCYFFETLGVATPYNEASPYYIITYRGMQIKTTHNPLFKKCITLSLLACSILFSETKKLSAQNIAINTTGAAAGAANMFEVIQPAAAPTDYVSIFAKNLSGGTNAYAIWAEATGATTGKYAIVVPSGGGNVGIGTTTPAQLLDITRNFNGYTLAVMRNNYSVANNGALSGIGFYNDNAASMGIIGLTSSAWNLGGAYPILGPNKVFIDANASMNGIVLNTEGAQPIVFGTSLTEKMRVDGNGNVGIGTSTPAFNLHVYTTNPVPGILAFTNYNPALTANSSRDYIAAFNRIDLSSGSFNFSSASNSIYGSVNRVNVAAGQTGGSVYLAKGSLSDVNHSGPGTVTNAWGSENQVINYSATGTITNATALVANIYNQSTGSITNGYGLSIGTVAATNKWSIYASDATAPSYFGGNVGVGIPVPTMNTSGKVLHIHENSTAAAGLRITNGTTGAAANNGFVLARWNDGSYGNGIIFWNYAATPLIFATNSAQRMYIDGTTGYVGIGTITPTSMLHVAGQVDVSSNKIINVTNPTAAQDAATLAYVEQRVCEATGGLWSGGVCSPYMQATAAAVTWSGANIYNQCQTEFGTGYVPANPYQALALANIYSIPNTLYYWVWPGGTAGQVTANYALKRDCCGIPTSGQDICPAGTHIAIFHNWDQNHTDSWDCTADGTSLRVLCVRRN